MTDFLQIPKSSSYRISNVTIPGIFAGTEREFAVGDICVSGEEISESACGPVVDAGSAMALPAFCDMHTHLDKGHIWSRCPNPDGRFESALGVLAGDRCRNWNADDVRRRMQFALECAYAHGTRAIRTHLDSAPPQHAISWPVFLEKRGEWAGRIDLQAVPLVGVEVVEDDGEFVEVADLAVKSDGILGCFTHPIPELEDRLEAFFRLAAERGLSADLHVDETKDPESVSLRIIAEIVLRTGFDAPVVVGHCCSLAQQTRSEAERTLDLVAEAGIHVVSLPMCNMYLQDRMNGRTPTWRGVTLVHEMRSRRISLSFASDNTRDPFFAYGDLDMVEVMREATRICHLDHSESGWVDAFTTTPAQVCGFSKHNLRPGDPADFVLFQARNWSEFFSRPQANRVVVRAGRAIERTLPQYSELDDLMEMA